LEDTNDALKLDGKLQADGRNIQIFSYKNHQADQKPEFKFATSVEKNKLFVRNVEFKSTEDELRQLFGQHGELKDVRIVRHKNGKPKGVAFIEFQNEESAQNALALNEYVFNGRTLEVHIR
jgi:RNA recognition motif-containing protein